MDAGHLAVRFAQAAAAHGSRPATRVAAGEAWLVRSYEALAGDVRRLAGRLIASGLELIEIAPGVDLDKDILGLMQFKPAVSPDLKLMDARIFRDEPMCLRPDILAKQTN